MTIATYNLAFTYAKRIVTRQHPETVGFGRLWLARKRVNRSLLALARINYARARGHAAVERELGAS